MSTPSAFLRQYKSELLNLEELPPGWEIVGGDDDGLFFRRPDGPDLEQVRVDTIPILVALTKEEAQLECLHSILLDHLQPYLDAALRAEVVPRGVSPGQTLYFLFPVVMSREVGYADCLGHPVGVQVQAAAVMALPVKGR